MQNIYVTNVYLKDKQIKKMRKIQTNPLKESQMIIKCEE